MSEWERLRALLLQHEQQRLKDLEQQQQAESRLEHLQTDLPQALFQLENDQALKRSLSTPVTAALHESIERDTEGVASLLFPVMGPAIRRAVQESLRSAIQRINLALEHGFSPKAWRWRLESWRSGEPFAQIVLRHSLSYSVDEVFLIHRESGLMLFRRTRREVLALDQDAVASMLTAIQNFLRQSLSSIADDPLRTVEMGAATIWLVNGPQAILAAVIQGEPPTDLREQLQEASEQIHALLREDLKHYKGDGITEPRVEALLDRQLVDQQPAPRNRLPGRLLALTLVIALVYGLGQWLWTWHELKQAQHKAFQYAAQTAGVVLIHSAIQDKHLHLSILRDPLAAHTDQLMQATGLEAEQIKLQTQSYLSQETEITLSRLMKAAGLEDPAVLELSDNVLSANRALSIEQWQTIKLLQQATAPHWQLNIPHYSEDELLKALQVPATVQMSQLDTEIVLRGHAPHQWRTKLADRLAQLNIRYHLNDQNLQTTELRQLQEIVESLHGRRLHFTESTHLASGSEAALSDLSQRLKQIHEWCRLLGKTAVVHIQGMSDGLGPWADNLRLRQTRAQYIVDRLTAQGVSQDLLRVDINNERLASEFQPEHRHVEIAIEVKDTAL